MDVSFAQNFKNQSTDSWLFFNDSLSLLHLCSKQIKVTQKFVDDMSFTTYLWNEADEWFCEQE